MRLLFQLSTLCQLLHKFDVQNELLEHFQAFQMDADDKETMFQSMLKATY